MGVCTLGACVMGIDPANESWIDEKQARGKNEFNVGLLYFQNFASENSPR